MKDAETRLSLKAIPVLAKPILSKTTAKTTSTWKCRRPLSGDNSAGLSYSPLLQWPSRYFVDLVSLFMKRSLLVPLSFDQLSNFSSVCTHVHTHVHTHTHSSLLALAMKRKEQEQGLMLTDWQEDGKPITRSF